METAHRDGTPELGVKDGKSGTELPTIYVDPSMAKQQESLLNAVSALRDAAESITRYNASQDPNPSSLLVMTLSKLQEAASYLVCGGRVDLLNSYLNDMITFVGYGGKAPPTRWGKTNPDEAKERIEWKYTTLAGKINALILQLYGVTPLRTNLLPPYEKKSNSNGGKECS